MSNKCVSVARVKCVSFFFLLFSFLRSFPVIDPLVCLSIHLHHTLSSQKKKKMATNRKRESCQLLLPLLRLPLPWWSPVYWSDEGGRWMEKVITPVSAELCSDRAFYPLIIQSITESVNLLTFIPGTLITVEGVDSRLVRHFVQRSIMFVCSK